MGKDALKEGIEKQIGDAFVSWFNIAQGTSYRFERRGDEPLDLLYRSEAGSLPIQVTVVYENQAFAALTWHTMRPKAKARRFAFTRDPDNELVESLTHRLRAKARMVYPVGSILVAYLAMPMTQLEFEGLLPRVRIPSPITLSAIYVGGTTSAPHESGDLGDWWLRIAGAA